MVANGEVDRRIISGVYHGFEGKNDGFGMEYLSCHVFCVSCLPVGVRVSCDVGHREREWQMYGNIGLFFVLCYRFPLAV